jgi:hypothetical protein
MRIRDLKPPTMELPAELQLQGLMVWQNATVMQLKKTAHRKFCENTYWRVKTWKAKMKW